MLDYNLKFQDEASALAVLKKDDQFIYPNTDIIGVIYKPTGKMLPTEYGDTPEMTPVDGWHVNIRCEEAPELEQYRVYPSTPNRVWL